MLTTLVGSYIQLAYILSWPMFLLLYTLGFPYMCCTSHFYVLNVFSEEEEEKALTSISVYERERERERERELLVKKKP